MTVRIPLTETYSHDPKAPFLKLDERAKTESWVRKLPDGRYRVRQMGQHCYISEGRGLQYNRNNRRYPAEGTWGKHTESTSAFMQRVGARRVIGQVEHPDSGRNDLGLAAMLITKVEPPRSSDGKVFVEWETLSTPGGKILASLIEDRVGFGLSSRGNGSVVRVDGVDEVQDDFEPVTFDAVCDESTPNAEIAATAIREGYERAIEAAGGDLNEAVRQDRAAAREAVNSLVQCLAEGGDPAACCNQALGEVQKVAEPTADNGKILAESGPIRARGFYNGLGEVDIIVETAKDGRSKAEIVETGVDTMHSAQQKALHYVAQAMQALATSDGTNIPVAGNNPGEPMIMPQGGEWILGSDDGEGHYQAFEIGPGSHQVWYVGHNLAPVLVASGLRTMKDCKAAAENHLHTVLGENNVREQAQVSGVIPFSGSMFDLRFDSPDQAKKGHRALKKAGYRCEDKEDNGLMVQSENPDEVAAMAQIARVLDGVGIEIEEGVDEMHGRDYMSRASYMGNYDMGYMDYDDDSEMDDVPMPAEPPEVDEMPMSHRDRMMSMMHGMSRKERKDMMRDMMDYMMSEDNKPTTFVGDPEVGLAPTEDEEDAVSPYEGEYNGRDPEDLDLDLDVNEKNSAQNSSKVAEDQYGQPGPQRPKAVVKASAKAKASGEMGGDTSRQNGEPDILKRGGSAEAQKKGTDTDGDYQRPAKEAGSNLPDRGKGKSMSQKAAKMAEALPRAVADMRTAWEHNDGETAAKISKFIESVGEAIIAGLSEHVSDSPRVRFLQQEVARLEAENMHLRTLNEAMTEVQRTEVLEMERKLILRDHPELAEAEETLKRCDTLSELQVEKDRLLRLVNKAGASQTNEGQETANEGAATPPVQENTEPKPAPAPVLESTNGSVSSLSVEGAPTEPLKESFATSGRGPVTRQAHGDTASRVAARKRRRRRG